ncbi:MAG: RdgB/HAM1 family non-canonical purine NTP pyrophosphatase [Pseudomonadota bacterium]
MSQPWVLASSNPGKLAELTALLGDQPVRPQTDYQIESVAETGQTFVENALLKARHAAQQTGLPALADDSGLAVDALNGAPGLYSARYAGPEQDNAANNRKLLHTMRDVPDAERTAQYHCVIVLLRYTEDPTPIICQGNWSGHILCEPRGSGGFGYDPLFWVASERASAAELTSERKHQLSHRAQALRQLLAAISA